MLQFSLCQGRVVGEIPELSLARELAVAQLGEDVAVAAAVALDPFRVLPLQRGPPPVHCGSRNDKKCVKSTNR